MNIKSSAEMVLEVIVMEILIIVKRSERVGFTKDEKTSNDSGSGMHCVMISYIKFPISPRVTRTNDNI